MLVATFRKRRLWNVVYHQIPFVDPCDEYHILDACAPFSSVSLTIRGKLHQGDCDLRIEHPHQWAHLCPLWGLRRHQLGKTCAWRQSRPLRGWLLLYFWYMGSMRPQERGIGSRRDSSRIFWFDLCLLVLLQKPLQTRPGLHFGGCPLNLDIFSENCALTPGKHPQPHTN